MRSVVALMASLAVLPPFHIYALSVNVLFGVLLGAEIIQHVRFDPKAALEEISSKQVSVFCGNGAVDQAPSEAPQQG